MSQELVVATRPISRGCHAPYLVADPQAFASDVAKREWYKQQWIGLCPRLGTTFREKIDWMGSIGSLYQMEQATMNWFVPNPKDIVSQVFYELAPPSLSIEVYCSKSDLHTISIADHVWFSTRFAKFSHKNYSGSPDWSNYVTWLATMKEDIVMLASIACKKTDRLHDKITELAENLTFDASLDGYSIMNSQSFSSNPAISWWSLVATAGENMYCPTPTSPCAVPVQLYFTHPSLTRETNTSFVRRLNGKSRYSREAVGIHYDYMVVPKTGRDVTTLGSVDKAKLCENFDILWLSSGFNQQVQRIHDHFTGNGETIEFQVFMQQGPAEKAAAIMNIFAAEFCFLKTFQRPDEQLVAALALTIVFSDISPSWLYCAETKIEAGYTVGKLGEFWRKQILATANEKLGINKNIRDVVYRALQLREEIFACGGLAFDWKPPIPARKLTPQRERTASPDSVVINAIVDEALGKETT